MPARMTADEAAFYEREGYFLFKKPVLPAGEFAALRQHFEHLLESWTRRGNGTSPEHMDVPHFTDPDLFRWLFADSVLDVVESVIGPDIALWSSHFICKPPGVGKRVPWHEDSAYWGTVLQPMNVVTVWLAIDDADVENGCMRLVPRTHHNGYSQYEAVASPDKHVFGTEIKKGQFDEATAVDAILKANECSLHHAKLVHGSNPNTSRRRRCGYTMRYIPASTRFDPEKRKSFPGFQIYLARGKDHAGNTYGDPTKINESWVNARPDEQARIRALTAG